MNNLFEIADAVLTSGAIDNKLALTQHAVDLHKAGELDFSRYQPIKPIDQAKFPERPVLMEPRHMAKRKLHTPEGIVAFFHAIAHVEFMAVNLAWDMVYRFDGMPQTFYQDWFAVAAEEAMHFGMIRRHLHDKSADYGDLPAHNGLWEHATATADDLLGRLAIVPRCLEARGLDVTPGLIAKFDAMGDTKSADLLNRILTDEIKHVERGSYWFKWACAREGVPVETTFRLKLDHYFLGGKPKGPFNREMRKIAGFSDAELDWLDDISSTESNSSIKQELNTGIR